jgi:hypothetical protein
VPIPRQTSAENKRVAALLSEQRLAIVRYFLLWITGDQEPWEWDFGVWHQPTMGVELATDDGSTFSALWSQYGEWGFGVDLFDAPMTTHLIEEAVDSWVDVSEHPSWASLLGTPVEVSFAWNDFGAGRPPMPEAIKIASTSAAAWIIAAGWERQKSRTSIQLGTDDLMVTFNETFVRTLGLFDPNRGRDGTEGLPARS